MSFIYNLLNRPVDAIDTQSKPTPIPICEEAKEKFNCNADWLSSVLGIPIQSFNIKPVGGGYLTDSYRINYTSSQENIIDSSVFVKYLIRANDEPFAKRLFDTISNMSLEKISRKEAVFYNHLHTLYLNHGILTPRPYYVALENCEDPGLLHVLGFKSDFRGVLILEDLGRYKSFKPAHSIPANYACFASAKLAQFHSVTWSKPIHPTIASEYIPDCYNLFFITQSLLIKNPNTKTVIDRINLWGPEFKFLTDPLISEALISFSEQQSKLLKYYSTDKLNSSPLFQHKTLLHGDFHGGNFFFITEPSSEDPQTQEIKDMVILDWQCYGYGHPSTDFSYFLGCVDFDPELDLKLMKIYYEELTKTIVAQDYSFEVFQREVEIRSIQITMGFFNMIFQHSNREAMQSFKESFDKKGIDSNLLLNEGMRQRLLRLAHIIEKWNQENIFERIEDI